MDLTTLDISDTVDSIKEVLEKIGDFFQDPLGTITSGLQSGFSTIISNIYSFKIELFGVTLDTDDMVGSVKSLTNFSSVKSNALFTIGSSINKIVTPVALSLLTLFFMYGLLKKMTEIEKVSWERIALWGAEFFFVKVLVDNAYTLTTSIMNIVNNIYSSITNISAISKVTTTFTLSDAITSSFEGQSLGGTLGLFALYLILALTYIGSIVQIWAQIILRVVKLMLCMSFSSVPIAMSIEGEVYRGKAISYLMYCAGVGFEAIIIYLGAYIYALGLSSVASSSSNGAFATIIGVLVLNALYIAVIQLGHEFSERLFSR